MYGSGPRIGFGVMTGGTLAATGFPAAGFALLALCLIVAGLLVFRSRALLARKRVKESTGKPQAQ